MRLLIVSDLHVWGDDDPLYESLLRLLKNEATPGDTVVLAGDLFDLFVGNKRIFISRYRRFFEGLREAGQRGVHVHYIEGNHDFLIRKTFQKIPGLWVHSSDVQIETGGRRFFVSHGDLVDRKDYGYRALRGFFRSPVMRAFIWMMPGAWIDWIGQTSSKRSRAKNPALPMQLPQERMDGLRRVYRNYASAKFSEGFDFVVMGHCHDLDEMRLKVGEREGQYINVGYPRTHGSFLFWSPEQARIERRPLP